MNNYCLLNNSPYLRFESSTPKTLQVRIRLCEPDQPNPTQPKFGPWRPDSTQLVFGPWRPNLTPNRFKLGSFGFIKNIIGLNPNLNSIWGQPDPIGPIFLPWGPTRPDSTQILGPKLGSTQKMGRVWPH